MNKVYEEALKEKVAEDKDGVVNIIEAIDMAAQSHQEVYPIDRGFFHWGSGCEPECIKAQLKKYYDKLDRDEALDAKKIGKDDTSRTSKIPER